MVIGIVPLLGYVVSLSIMQQYIIIQVIDTLSTSFD